MAAIINKSSIDWKAYEAKAVMRGNLMLFISPEIASSWYVKTEVKPSGGQPIYTDRCIEDIMSLKYLFGISYRHLEGFIRGLLSFAGLGHLPSPDRSTINDRAKSMKLKLPHLSKPKSGYVVSLDSTGLKIHGQGEWNRKKHKQRDRANWVKMHLAIDNKTMQILAVKSTADDVQDPEVFNTLIDSLPSSLGKVMGDGAYDTLNAYKRASDDKFNLIVPPRDNAVINLKATEPHVLARNKQVEYYQQNGIYAWANKNDYWDRNRVETTMSRFVTTFTDKLSSRTVQAQQNEIVIKCHILNILMAVNEPVQDSAA